MMLSQDYYGFSVKEKQWYKLIGRRTQLSQTKINKSRYKDKFKYDQLELEKLKQKYINKKYYNNQKYLYNQKEKKCYSLHLNDLKFRYYHYNDCGGYNYYQQIKKKVQKRALQALQRNLTPSSKLSSKNGLVNSNHSRNLQQNLLQKKASRQRLQFHENKKKDNNNIKIQIKPTNVYNVKSVSNLLQRNFKKQTKQNKNKNINNNNNNNFDQYYLKPKNKKSDLILQNLHQGITSMKKLDKQNYDQIHKQQQMMEISLNSRQDFSSLQTSKNNHLSKLQPKNLATSDYDIIKQLEQRAKQQQIQQNHKYIQTISDRPSTKKSSQLGSHDKVENDEYLINNDKLQDSIKFQFNNESAEHSMNRNTLSPFFKASSDNHSMIHKIKGNTYMKQHEDAIKNTEQINFSALLNHQQKPLRQKIQNKADKKNSIIQNQNNVDKQQVNKIIPNQMLLTQFNLLQQLIKLNSMQNYKIYNFQSIYSLDDDKQQHVIQKLYQYLLCINKIQDFVQQTQQFYLDYQQRKLFHQCSYLLLKKSYQEKQQIIQSIQHGKSCFKLTGRQILDKDIQKIKLNHLVKIYCQNILGSNRQLYKIIQKFYQSMVNEQGFSNTALNRKQLTKQNINYIMQKLNEQLELLINKIDDSEQKSIYLKDNEYEAISLRCFTIMELTFLISELQGRKIKKMQHSIEPEEFQIYCKANYGLFKETVLCFH